MDKIIDNLYLGDIRAAANLFLLKQHVRYFLLFHYHKITPLLTISLQGVTHILQVLAGLNPCFPSVSDLSND